MTADTTTQDLLTATKALTPLIKKDRDEMETQRRLSDTVVRALGDAGIFRALYPRSLGGLEISPLVFMEVIEELSRADASTGWCALATAGSAHIAGRLKNKGGKEMFGEPPDIKIAGTIIPRGEAHLVDGGFRVSGEYTFGSGIDYSNWLMCLCRLFDLNGVKLTPEGNPETVMMFVPIEQAVVHDTWSAYGMCATGSHDYTLEEVFVPAELSLNLSEPTDETGPLFNPRPMMVYLLSPAASCVMGIARGAMDTFVETLAGSGTNASPIPLRDRPAVQSAVGQAEAAISSSRSFLMEAVADVWGGACRGEPESSRTIARARLAAVNAIRESARAVNLLYEAAGTTAIYRSHPIDRSYRDISVLSKSWVGSATNIDSAGAALLGVTPQGPGW